MKKWLPAQRSKHNVQGSKHNVKNKSNVLDMEVLIASESNPILLPWLCYLVCQIEEKNYAHSPFWQKWKMRYIYHSTGPKCMSRFLHLKCNVEVRRTLKFLSSNNFVEGADVSMSAKRMYDVLSFESRS